jgi:hypothetical protein
MRPRFTLRDLLLAVSLLAIGMAGLRLAFSIGDGRDIGPLDGAMMLLGLFAAAMLVGAAVAGLLANCWLWGATFGLLVQFILLLLITGAY